MPEILPINASQPTSLNPATSPFSAPSFQKTSDTLAASTAMPTQKALDRPKLDLPNLSSPAPTGLTEFRLLALMEKFHTFGDGLLFSMKNRLEAFKSKLHEVSEENIQNIKASAEKAKSSHFWSILQKVATALLSALSIVMGISLIATGGGALIGGAMIASGILSIANFVLTESGTWEWMIDKLSNEDETKRHYLSIILPAAVGIVCAAIGIFGAVGATLWTATTVMSKAALIAQATLATFEGISTIGKGHADANLIWSQADLLSSSSQMTVQKHRIDHTMKEVDCFLNELNAIQEQTARSIRSIIASNQLLVTLHG